MNNRWLLIVLAFVIIFSMPQLELTGASTANTQTELTILKNPNIFTRFDKYSPYINETIKLQKFNPGSTVELDIRNSTTSLSGFPVNVTIDFFGTYNYFWEIKNTSLGNYTIYAADIVDLEYVAQKQIQILPAYNWTGRIINSENTPEGSTVLVYDESGKLTAIDDEVYTLTFNYGMYYDVYITPTILSGIDKVHFEFMANQGSVGDILVIDDVSGKSTDSLPHTDFSRLFITEPLISNYKSLEINLSFSPLRNFGVYKCSNWNITPMKCNENYTLIQNLTDYSSNTFIELTPGDPALGIAYKPTICGDNFCQPGESYSNCPADCSIIPSAGGGAGGIPTEITIEEVEELEQELGIKIQDIPEKIIILKYIIEKPENYNIIIALLILILVLNVIFLYDKKRMKCRSRADSA